MPNTHTAAGSSHIRHIRWAVPFVAALAPIILMTAYADSIAVQSVRQLTEAQQLSLAGNLVQHTQLELQKSLLLTRAFASVEGTVEAAQTRDIFMQSLRLKALIVAYPAIRRSAMLDAQGTVMSAYPGGSGALSADGMWRAHLTPANTQRVSEFYADPAPAVTIATPIGGTGASVGWLITEVPLAPIREWIGQISLPQDGTLFLLDHTGRSVFADPDNVGAESYAQSPAALRALHGETVTVTQEDPQSGETVIATFQPVVIGEQRWVAVAQQPLAVASGAAVRVRVLMIAGGLMLTIATLWLIVALARASARIIHLNRDLEEKNRRLEEADRMKDDFVSFVSHQLKAPVTSIRLGVDALLKEQLGHLPDGAKRILTQLKDISAQSFKLITDLLNTSRINRGVIDVELADVPLNTIAERAVRDYRVVAEQAGLTLTIAGAEQNMTVHADSEKMGEAVSNAVSNAIKHTKQGGITLTMYTKDGYGCIDVTDTGEGMSPEVISKLFTRDQIFGASAHAEHSAGLGLYIAKHFMELQKGDVSVTSEVGKGSTFTYRVPLSKGAEEVKEIEEKNH